MLFRSLQRDDNKLTKWLDPTVRVLHAFSETLGEGVSLVCLRINQSRDPLFISISQTFSPAKVIFAGVGVLLSVRIFRWTFVQAIVIPFQAAMDIRASHDTLIDIFERMETFFQRLEIYTRVSPPPEMIDMIVKIMVEVLSVLGIATKEMKQGRTSK